MLPFNDRISIPPLGFSCALGLSGPCCIVLPLTLFQLTYVNYVKDEVDQKKIKILHKGGSFEGSSQTFNLG